MKLLIIPYRDSHFLTYYCFFTLLFFASTQMLAQVGVNTTNPDASSILDITSSNKGLLVPRVSLSNVTNNSLDGSNTAAIGLLIWNTNASTTGGAGIGYYYFNGTTWEKIITNNTTTTDNDWYAEGTTTAPTTITDDIFTQGNVAIGKNTADYPLDIETPGDIGVNMVISGTDNNSKFGNFNEITNTGNGYHFGSYNNIINNGSGFTYGSYNYILSSGTGNLYGSYNELFSSPSNGGNVYGTYQQLINFGTAPKYGSFNEISGFDDGLCYGNYQELSSTGNGDHYGSYNSLSGSGYGRKYGNYINISATAGGTKYGSFIEIDPTSNGDHYGIFSYVTKSTGYAGYFIGRMSIGTTSTNNYILPSSRGAANQIMQTDGSGNVSWVNSNSISWSLTGNSGTNATTNFIGTTDNVNLSIKTNNVERILVKTDGTTEIKNELIINSIATGTEHATILNDDNYSHPTDNNLDFGTGGSDYIIASQQNTSESAGLHGDGDSNTLWSPGDGNRQLRILDEDNWSDNDGNPYNNNAEVGYIDATGQYLQASDKNRKQDIKKLEDALSKIEQLNGYTYQFKINAEERQKGQKNKTTSGVIAQELYKVLPEAVEITEYGEYFVHYAGITPLLIEGIKELKKENDQLKEKQKFLEERLTKIEALLQNKN